ncbi:type II toxin-antitoxin system HicB family antitoxin [Pantoea trifolii]|uniref:type II toxin-antitoxin system HicB family antitoxin n=1 Tax=Candidatus Pantoea symbiotica TaxID=1884370 RepID=UPI00077B8CF6|nr:type II toxin-antitoxin system HicB family antitoxin [Pantoea rodasii]MDY0928511.1 type II toxin-antitoxin system HicB family antitoxin [Enterobacter sp. CFBP8995]
MRFPVYLHKTESNTYSGFVPDVVGCFFAGETVDDALTDASAAIDAHVEWSTDAGYEVPVATSIETHIEDENCQGGYWAFVDIDLSRYEGKAVKLNITLPQNLLTKIDSYVDHHREYGSRSGFLAALARKELANA